MSTARKCSNLHCDAHCLHARNPTFAATFLRHTVVFAPCEALCPSLQEAAKQCKRILRSDPHNFPTLLRLGIAKRKSGANEVPLLPFLFVWHQR